MVSILLVLVVTNYEKYELTVSCRSSFQVDTRDLEHPVVNLEVLIDGSSKYKYVFSIPVPLSCF